MKQYLLLLLLISTAIFGQTKKGSSFSGNLEVDRDVCPPTMQFKSEKEVNDLITGMLDKLGMENRYIVMKCTGVDNCQATLFNGKPYILYNPLFLNSVSRLNFTTDNLPEMQQQDWASLTILAHELGHHTNNHLSNPLPDATALDMELEADKTAGFIIYLMKGSLINAQLAYKALPEKSTYDHPGRDKRNLAVETGWKRAEKLYPRVVPSTVVVTPPEPKKKVVVNPSINSMVDVDGNNYGVKSIGNQIWMTENVEVSHYRNGDVIPEVTDATAWGKLTTGAWCYFQNDKTNGNKYGKLYNWYAVNDPRGLAPEGWHIPTIDEFSILTNFLGGTTYSGVKMKTTIGWEKVEGGKVLGFNVLGDNSSGFSGLPGGRRLKSEFSSLGYFGYWWSSSIGNNIFALSFDTKYSFVNYGMNFFGNAVRCVKD